MRKIKDLRPTRSFFTVIVSAVMVLSFTACSGESSGPGDSTGVSDPGSGYSVSVSGSETETDSGDSQASVSKGGTDTATDTENDILVAFFSHTGENYNVGFIEKGNTHIIADMIAGETGADIFEIRTVNTYPDSYKECLDVAKQEQKDNARPEIVDPPEDLDGYDTVFIGYPIWWGDMPMAVYTFLEKYDFSGKTVIPFSTSEGSGLSGTESTIGNICSGASVSDGFTINGSTAQKDRDEAESKVKKWLNGLGM